MSDIHGRQYNQGGLLVPFLAQGVVPSATIHLCYGFSGNDVNDKWPINFVEAESVGYAPQRITPSQIQIQPPFDDTTWTLGPFTWHLGFTTPFEQDIGTWVMTVAGIAGFPFALWGGLLPTPIHIPPAGITFTFDGITVSLHDCGTPTPPEPTMPVGSITAYAGSGALPAGTLECLGQPVSRTTFSALFGVVGTTFGAGDGSTTFNVPDLRDRVPIGTSPGGLGSDRPTARALADSGGEEAHTLLLTELAQHTHAVTDPGHSHTPSNGANFQTDSTSSGPSAVGPGGDEAVAATTTELTGIILDSAGADAAHNTMQPYLACRWLIWT